MSGTDHGPGDDKSTGLMYFIFGDLRAPWKDLEKEHPRVVHALWRWSVPALLVLAALDIWVHHHEHFGYDGIPGFYSFYGLMACVVMVVFSKTVVSLALKRKDTYYDNSEDGIDGLAIPPGSQKHGHDGHGDGHGGHHD